MKVFVPLSTQLLPWRSAVVVMPRTAEPAPGSVRQNAARAGILASLFGLQKRGRYFFFCSGVAIVDRPFAARDEAERCTYMPASPQQSSSEMTAAVILSVTPIPPYSEG